MAVGSPLAVLILEYKLTNGCRYVAITALLTLE